MKSIVSIITVKYGKCILFLCLFCAVAGQGYGQRHFVPVWTGNGFQHMNIYVYSAAINERGLTTGDEIAVFDGIYCVGAIQLQGPIQQFVSFVVSMNDPTTPERDGYIQGNQMIFKIWDNQNRIEYSQPEMNVNYIQGSNRFSVGGTSVVTLRMIVRAPQNLQISLTETQVILNWDAVINAVTYRVYSGTTALTANFVLDNTGVLNGTNWTAPLPIDKRRFYFVKSVFDD